MVSARSAISSAWRSVIVLSLGVSSAIAGTASLPTPTRSLAVTIDDLPYSPALNEQFLPAARKSAKGMLSALRRFQAPAVGFVNEAKLNEPGERDKRVGLLNQWAAAGVLLGNHTFSHLGLSHTSVSDFEDDIVRGDIVTREIMRGRGAHTLWFRHPYTQTGDTAEKKESVNRFLASRGYRVAPHTIDSADYIFNWVYVDALGRKNSALARSVRDAYLKHLEAATEFAEHISQEVFGHEIPQTLLIHSSALNAEALGDVLAIYVRRGYRFTSLDEASSDPAYATPDTLITPSGPTWLWRWSRSLRQNISFRADPEPPDWVSKAYEALQVQRRK